MTASLTTSRYSPVAIAFHWSIAALVIVNLALGIGHEAFGKDNVPAIMGIHKSIGFTVLVLSLLRLGWRIGHPAPPLPARMPGRSEEHTSELQSLMRISYAVFFLKNKFKQGMHKSVTT